MSDARPDIPDHLAHRPVYRGLPVPHIVSWSSEGQITVANDPIAGRVAVFTKGRPGRGRPLFGVMHPARQRHAILLGVCQICGLELPEAGYLPNHPKLVDSTDNHGGQWILEPPCCEPCARWAATGCPGIRGTVTDIIVVDTLQPVAQLLDLTDWTVRYADRWDRTETDDTRARLNRIMRRYPQGVAGHIRYTITKSEKLDL